MAEYCEFHLLLLWKSQTAFSYTSKTVFFTATNTSSTAKGKPFASMTTEPLSLVILEPTNFTGNAS